MVEGDVNSAQFVQFSQTHKFFTLFTPLLPKNSQECDCQGKTLNYSRRKPANGTNGGQSPSSTDRGAVGPDGSGGPFCVCQHANDTASGRKEYPDTASAFGTASNGGAAGETILSSNIRFQSISAIAVAQDGVINVADQGESRNGVGIVLANVKNLISSFPPTAQVRCESSPWSTICPSTTATASSRYRTRR